VLHEADFRAMLRRNPAIKAQIDREVGLRSKMNLDAEQKRR